MSSYYTGSLRLFVVLVAWIGFWAVLTGVEARSAEGKDGPPTAKDAQEEKILAVLDDLDKHHRRGNMNVPAEDGRLLRLLVEATDAKKVVEIGTSTGYSGIWMCLGLRKTGGKLITHDIDEGRAAKARENFAKAGVADMVTLVMGDAHEKIKNLEGPVDLVFIDAEKSGYPDYLKQMLPLVRPGGLIVSHNTSMRGEDMARYNEMLQTDPNLETLYFHVDNQGISVSLKKR